MSLGFPDCLIKDTEVRLCVDGAQGSDLRKEETEPSPDSVCLEACGKLNADVPTSGVASESYQEAL